MNILFCGDKNITDGVIIATLSLLKHKKQELNVYILTATIKTKERTYQPIPSEFEKFLDDFLKRHNKNNFVKLIDVTNHFNTTPPTANLKTRFTPCCTLRLYADLVEELPSKILYLDNDVICRKDLSELYDTDVDSAEVCGVLDYYGGWLFRKKALRRDYLNSGVLLLNLDKIRKTRFFEKCRILCQNKKMFMPDQSAINSVAENKVILPRKFNEQRKLSKDTVIQHFTTSFRFFPFVRKVTAKPWNIDDVHKKLKIREYDELLTQFVILKKKYEKLNLG